MQVLLWAQLKPANCQFWFGAISIISFSFYHSLVWKICFYFVYVYLSVATQDRSIILGTQINLISDEIHA